MFFPGEPVNNPPVKFNALKTLSQAGHFLERLPSFMSDAYDRNRRVGGAPAASRGPGFRPQFSTTLTLFGSPVTLGPAHALGLGGPTRSP